MRLVFDKLFKRKYILYCKQEKRWEQVAELDHYISLPEAKALYGEDCDQLRLELVDKRGKRIKMVWVEPPRKKKQQRTPTLTDYLLEFKLVSGALAELLKDVLAITQIVNPYQQGGGNKSSSDPILELLKELIKARVSQPIAPAIPPQMMQQPQQPPAPQEVPEININPEEIEERLKEHTLKDIEDIENAPCKGNQEKCIEGEE